MRFVPKNQNDRADDEQGTDDETHQRVSDSPEEGSARYGCERVSHGNFSMPRASRSGFVHDVAGLVEDRPLAVLAFEEVGSQDGLSFGVLDLHRINRCVFGSDLSVRLSRLSALELLLR